MFDDEFPMMAQHENLNKKLRPAAQMKQFLCNQIVPDDVIQVLIAIVLADMKKNIRLDKYFNKFRELIEKKEEAF